MSFTVPPTVRTRGSAAYCGRFPTRPANRAPHFFALALCAALAACKQPAPSPEVCDDYRIMTYYRDYGGGGDWFGPGTAKFCIVREQKVAK
jgi:hypothetical protein